MANLCVKPGVQLDRLSIGGACILGALFRTAVNLPFDLVVTSGTDGTHSGPTDPHYAGDAFDVRSKGFEPAQKAAVFAAVMADLLAITLRFQANGALVNVSGGQATALFFGWLEHEGLINEHWHFQVRKGRKIPVPTEIKV